jgi:phosphoglycerol transferase
VKQLRANLQTQAAIKLSALGASFVATFAWVLIQVRDINPAILQDEWIYLITSRNFSPWEQNLPFDFGNYLFNLVYSSTLLCGDAFYTCAKVINLTLLHGFALTLFVIALRFIPFWGALVFFIATALSPTMVYGSMYLPESLLFFFLGLSTYFVLKAADDPTWKNWAIAGIPLGLAALAKPHALMAAVAIGIYLIINGIERRPYWKPTVINALALLVAFLVIRVVVGFLVAGPKSLNVFGAYGATSAIGTFVGEAGGAGAVEGALVGAGPVAGAVGLFPTQIYTHLMVIAALLGAAVVALIIAAIDSIRTLEVRPVHRFALLAIIWLVVLVIMIVLFTGWITGGGDDHTTRVLLRYYDYLFPIVMLAGVAVFFDKQILADTKAWIRWIAIAPVFFMISAAYVGYFGTLTIQIADAPNLAGLVVDKFTIDVTANLMLLTLLVMAFAPKFTVWAAAAMVPFVMIGTGYQIQDQYRGFRLEPSQADLAGQFVKGYLPQDELADVLVLAESRFDGRVASFWMGENTDLEILGAGSVYPLDLVDTDTEYVLVLGNLALDGGELVSSGEGYQLLKLER